MCVCIHSHHASKLDDINTFNRWGGVKGWLHVNGLHAYMYMHAAMSTCCIYHSIFAVHKQTSCAHNGCGVVEASEFHTVAR
jgi:hypothetical protein